MVSKVETNPTAVDHAALYALLTEAFAYMADRIAPPSSLTRMTLEDVIQKTEAEDVFVITEHQRPIACLFGTPADDAYYIGKLAVADHARGQGHARALIDAAERRALALGYNCLELQSRVELVENHATFARMGFVKTGETAHSGYTRPTSFTFRRPLPSPQDAPGL